MSRQLAWLKKSLAHPAKTAIAAVLALLAARFLRSPEAFWAPISAMIVMQSNLGAALTVSWRRLVGTALGCAVGALLLSCFGASLIVYGAGVFGIGLLCAALRLERSAYRFAGITLTVVMFVGHTQAAWIIATHRFEEVSVGIVVGLIVTVVWPDDGAS